VGVGGTAVGTTVGGGLVGAATVAVSVGGMAVGAVVGGGLVGAVDGAQAATTAVARMIPIIRSWGRAISLLSPSGSFSIGVTQTRDVPKTGPHRQTSPLL